MKICEQKKKGCLVLGITAMLVVVLVAIFMISNSGSRKLTRLLDLGQKYIENMDYENAILVFDQAIAIEPRCEEAYLGKAQAQYASGRYEDAVATLEEGIANVDNSSGLKELLCQILTEIEEKEVIEEETVLLEERTIPLSLNYSQIVRYIDTEEPTIQLEILGEEGGREKYIWESSDPECAIVSETGLVTCLPNEGSAYITVTTEDGTEHDGCWVWVINPEGSDVNAIESEVLWTIVDSEKEKEQFFILPVPKDDDENIVVGDFSKLVYFSGDISIPEKLQYKGKSWPITGIYSDVFMYCDELECIHIPSTVEVVEKYDSMSPFFYCTSLREINVDEDNKYWKSVDGILYSADGKELLSYPAAKSNRTYILPKEVEKVSLGAFVGCSNLEEILVEEGNQFYESINGSLIQKEGRNLVAYPIGNKASSYKVPDSVEEIGSGAFDCAVLEEVICKSVKEIDTRQFRNCDRLERIVGGSSTVAVRMDMAVEIAGIDEMKNLRCLEITLAEEQKFANLASLQKLETVGINVNGRSPDLESFSELSNVEYLELFGIDNIKDFSWIPEMDRLKTLSLSIENKKTDLQVLKGLANLESLYINGANYVKDFSWLSGLKNLKSLSINLNCQSVDLQPLGQLDGLDKLYISEVDNIKDFFWLANLDILKEITLIADNSSGLEAACMEIGKLKNVESVIVYGINKLEDISWLENMNSLTSLELRIKDKFNVTGFTPIMELYNLKRIKMRIPKEDKERLNDSIEELKIRNMYVEIESWISQ